ncbi:hypothetical protein ABTX81_06670 [Kitasatospora sp. NPDC097605]|uniref:hypothetical protein n=1 Tax=Kitasatospora sp. NPDC097605 TaxID=3157226 RepID=UPI00332595C4
MPTWTSVSSLSVVLESGGKNCDIYANGRNRIAVTVNIEPTDENADPIEVDPKYLFSRIWLIDYVTQAKLAWNWGSDWSYTESPGKFAATPGSSGEHSEVSATEGGIQQVTFYVYCGSGVSNAKSIGVLVKTESDDTVTSSLNGTYNDSVTLNPLTAVAYRKGDVTWDYARTTTVDGGNKQYVTTDAWNYYLSLKSSQNYFVTFSVSNYSNQDGFEGFFSGHIPADDDRSNFYGGYVWPQEPHDSVYYDPYDGHSLGEVVDFPDGNLWCDYARIYDRSYPERYLCFTWVHSTTGGNGWHIPNGPMTNWHAWWTPEIVAYDRYGNSGKFWVDGAEIIGGLSLYDSKP